LNQAAAHQHLERLSTTDAMTGLLNRRAFDAAMTKRLADGGRVPGVLTYVDLDNFKKVNDVRGHQVGDQALIHLADILKRQIRKGDMVARLGGDEFALWMENVSTDGAPARAEWILETGKELLEYSGAPEYPVGLSIGMAVFAPGSGETREQLIERADAVMYEIKHGGKGWYRIAAPAVPADKSTGPNLMDSES
jgi:diguanylate cyclase (GGDEF)-like protein